MKGFLKRKNINISPKVYFIDALGAMAYGLFASLLVGTILNTIGIQFNIPFLSETLWPLAKQATGAAIAVSIAYALKAPDLVLFSSTVVGLAGNEAGGPIGVFIATIIGVELGKLISKETKIDIVITPIITIFSGVTVATFIGPGIGYAMTKIGELIMFSTRQQPFLMGILVSVLVGLALTLPISSAAICMMLSLSGLAGGAATVGCCCQMVGFAVISFKDNGIEGLVAQGLGTSMLQMSNIIKNKYIWLPPTIASAILGPVSTLIFKLENTPLGSGMGTSGLVGQIGTINAMSDKLPFGQTLSYILILQIVLPALLSYLIYRILRAKGLIKDGDMKLAK